MVHLSASWAAEGRGAAIMNAVLHFALHSLPNTPQFQIICVALTLLYAVETFLNAR